MKSVVANCGVFLLAVLGCTQSALASLGGTPDSIETDRSALNGRTQVTQKDLYSIQEITAGSRKIREFCRKDGTVFAVSWQGPVPPDLSVILGKYFGEFQAARTAAGQPRSRGARITRSEHLVVKETGHMRDVRGNAILPGLLPQGLNPAEIR